MKVTSNGAGSPASARPVYPGLLVQRSCACGGQASALSGECDACRQAKRLGAQARLTIGDPGDAYEREADRVAEQVSGAIPPSQRPRISAVPSAGPSAGMSRMQQQPGGAVGEGGAGPSRRALTLGGPEGPPLLGGGGLEGPTRRAGGAHEGRASHGVHDVLAEGGQSLDAGSRALFEPRFGHDFSRVRVHAGSQAAQSAAGLGARAYTVGRHIVFGDGQYAPGAESGRRLLGHELTHVIQQGEGTRGDGSDLVQRQLVFGSGYANPFAGNPAGETAAAQKDPREWFPSSVDFGKTAELSGGGTGIATLVGLLAEIGGKSAGSITDLDLIGHANGDLFALGGTITRTSVSGSGGGTIGATQLAAAQPEIDKVRDRFASGAHITIYGCNSGASGNLLAAISSAFKVCARGFKDAITWCLGWQTKPIKINSRGRTLINPPVEATSCDAYEGSIYNHTSDVEDCSGTKAKAPDVTLPPRTPQVPQVPE